MGAASCSFTASTSPMPALAMPGLPVGLIHHMHGESFALATPSSGDPTVGAPGSNGAGKLIQGALESSNVNVVEELVNMIETQRAYEINSKAISAVDGMLKFLNQNI